MNKEDIRNLFYNLDNINHLAACSKSPLLKNVDHAMQEYLDDVKNLGNPWDLWSSKVEEPRHLFARLINANDDEIAILYSVSSCLNALMSSFNFGNKNSIITSDLEYPTTNFILNAYRKYGLTVKTIRNTGGIINTGEYSNYIDNNTLMMTATHVSSLNGFKQDVGEIAKIAHKNSAYIYVDDYQSLGALNMDVRSYRIDFLASGNLKWLLGTSGIAFLYVNKSIANELEPTNIGWFSQKNPFEFGSEKLDYADGARRFENGTWSIPSVYAAIEGMKTIIKYKKYIEEENKKLFDYTMELLEHYNMKTITSQHGANIVSIDIKNPAGAEKMLKSKYKIITSARGNSLRIAPHFYNTYNEIENAIRVIKDNFQ